MNQEKFSGIIRHVASFAAGIAVAKGWIDNETALQIVAGIVAVSTAIWSWKAKNPKP